MLLRLPGVTAQNCHLIMRHVRNIRELACMERDSLAQLIGPADAHRLHAFMHTPIMLET